MLHRHHVASGDVKLPLIISKSHRICGTIWHPRWVREILREHFPGRPCHETGSGTAISELADVVQVIPGKSRFHRLREHV